MQEDRILGIISILIDKRQVKARELAVRFGVSIRTIYRDIDALIQVGVNIETTQGIGGGIVLIDDRDIYNKADKIFNKPIKRDGKIYVQQQYEKKIQVEVNNTGIRSIGDWLEKFIYTEKIAKNREELILYIDQSMSFRVYDELEGMWERNDREDFIIRMDVVNNEWLYSYLLSYGDRLKIVSPPHIREEMKKRIALCYRRYQ
jgi:predicted DNA-binding transcriptional regulator YafY